MAGVFRVRESWQRRGCCPETGQCLKGRGGEWESGTDAPRSKAACRPHGATRQTRKEGGQSKLKICH